jgi:hypothetical protein
VWRIADLCRKSVIRHTQVERAEVAAAFSFGVSKEDLLRTLNQALSLSKCLDSCDPCLKEK